MHKIVIAVLLTLLLGPGAGHLYLRLFKRAAALILGTILAAFALAAKVSISIPREQLAAANPAELFQNYIGDHPVPLFYFNAVIAAIWAYALLDAFLQAKAVLPPAGQRTEE